MRLGDVVAQRFEIQELAGTGGMGSVFRAVDLLYEEPVAIKVLHAQRGGDRFLREAEVLADLRHPCIVRYVAHGITPDGERWLAMEWLAGVNLAERLARGPLPLGEAVRLVVRVAEAAGAAHARGVLHRDINPSNVLLVAGDVDCVKLLDFGVVRVGPSPTSTALGAVIGTPGYMAPEQARGSREIGPQVDVFALGCVLFQCLVGRPAFFGEPLAVLAKIILEDAPRLREIDPALPPALEDLCARMMAKDPGERPSNGRSVAAALVSLGDLGDVRDTTTGAPAAALTRRERKLMCAVLAGGVLGLTPTIEQDQAFALLAGSGASQATAPLDAAASAHGGRLEKLADGSVIVTFTGEGPVDQVTRAARCAFAVRALAPEAPMAMVLGRGQLDGRYPVGEVIERGARLLRSAESDGAAERPIRIDDLTAGVLGSRFDVALLPARAPDEPDGLALGGEREVVAVARTLLGKRTPFVGRERELMLLSDVFDQCASEALAQLVLVTGPSGMGKSRLMQEFLRELREREAGLELWIARGDPMRAGAPFGMLGAALRRAMGVLDGEPPALRRRKVAARVSRDLGRPIEGAIDAPESDGARRRRITEFLGELVGVAFPDDDSVQLRAARRDPVLMSDQIRRAWGDWLRVETEIAPVLIVLEDLQWGDLPTVQLIDAAMSSHTERPLMILALARPEVSEVFPGLWSKRAVQQVRLGGLTERASEKLMRAVLDDHADDSTRQRIVRQAEGNPLHLEELIRAVAEGNSEPPPTVVAMVQARLEALDVDARRVLRAASVFGRTFWREGVQALLGGGTPQLREWLGTLVAREVVARRGAGRFPGQDEYYFPHALVREAAYAMLTDADRRLGHELAARWLSAAGEHEAALLAEHFERGGRPARAVRHWVAAAEAALDANDLAQATARAERAVGCGASGSLLGMARWVQAQACGWTGDYRAVLRFAVEAIDHLPPGEPAFFKAIASATVSAARLGGASELERAMRARVLETPPSSPDARAARALALARVAWGLVVQGEREQALMYLREAHAEAGRLPSPDPTADAHIARGEGLAALWVGDVGAAVDSLRRASEAFERAGDLRELCVDSVNLGSSYLSLGQHDLAEPVLRRALAVAETHGLSAAAGALLNLGVLMARREAYEDACALQRRAAEAFRSRGDKRLEGGTRICLSEILLSMGDWEEAEREARTAAELLTQPAMRLVALAAIAAALLPLGRVDEALGHAREAASALEALGGVEYGEWLVWLTLARAHSAAGDPESARRAAHTGRDRLLARAAKIRDEAWRRSYLESVPTNAELMRLADSV